MPGAGSACIAHETRCATRSLGLTPVNTPVCSPQSNGLAKIFVNTLSSLKIESPREFKRQRVEQPHRAQPEQPALHCLWAVPGCAEARSAGLL